MAKQNQKAEERESGLIESLPSGLTLRHTSHQADLTRSIDWSPSGDRIAYGSVDGNLSLADAWDGTIIKRIATGCALISMAMDPRGDRIAVLDNKSEVTIWTVDDGKMRVRQKLQVWSTHLGFTRSGAMIAASTGGNLSIDNNVLIHAELSSHSSTGRHDTYSTPVRNAYSDPCAFDDTLVAAVSTGRLSFCSVIEPHLKQQMASERLSSISSLAVNRFKRNVAAGCHDGRIAIIDFSHKDPIKRVLEGLTGRVSQLDYSSDGKLLAALDANGNLQIWKTESAELIVDIRTYSTGVEEGKLMRFSPTSYDLAVVLPGNKIADLPQRSIVLSIEDKLLTSHRSQSLIKTSAKVVIVGESNIGKSYLAHRIAKGEAPPIGFLPSTHGMKFWPLPIALMKSTRQMPVGSHREVVLWDMGGQEEYRLIHQLFLGDTTVALVLFDPTRGASAYNEVRLWNKYLERQLKGSSAVKLLVGAKLDNPSDRADAKTIWPLTQECGFKLYCETSALTGRGIDDICGFIDDAIDWEHLRTTGQRDLFRFIEDEINVRRIRGDVVVGLKALADALGPSFGHANELEVDVVAKSLARQGIIARSTSPSGDVVLVLQVHEIERYAGALILAARRNPRGVPALELRAILQDDFAFPGIAAHERLSRTHEIAVLECTAQIMLEHGVCFEHEGLLVFPSLFTREGVSHEESLPHTIALYYDFAGAIDNIYSSLVAWLVLARDFGSVRLHPDRAEFQRASGEVCGLRRVSRDNGFAHVDVYFDEMSTRNTREDFITFVEDHLERNGIEVREQLVVTCPKGAKFDSETISMRIAEGATNVLCPRCEARHSLVEGADTLKTRDPRIQERSWALRTRVEIERKERAIEVVKTVAMEPARSTHEPIRILHLSDLHFTSKTPVDVRFQWLADDLKGSRGLGITDLDYIIVSGDFTDRGEVAGFNKAYEFMSLLTREFRLSAERCLLVPGNHDIFNSDNNFKWMSAPPTSGEEFVLQGSVYLVPDDGNYRLRFRPFSDLLYHRFLQRVYPLDPALQSFAIPFHETKLQFILLNSCNRIDQFHRKRSGVDAQALSKAMREAQAQLVIGKNKSPDEEYLRIAIWHHAVAGPEQIQDAQFLSNLQKNGVKVALHGDVHEMRRDLIYSRLPNSSLHIIGGGSFGATGNDRPESTPRLYNVLEIGRDRKALRVHTRCQPKPEGAWEGWFDWPDPHDPMKRVSYFDIVF